jgi:hypothetical protein
MATFGIVIPRIKVSVQMDEDEKPKPRQFLESEMD